MTTALTPKTPVAVLQTIPTADMPLGVYKVICSRGLFWGHYKVCRNWCGDRFVMPVYEHVDF